MVSIAGTNFQFDRRASDDSYYFSRYSMTWGWATWRRAWERHDREMTAWPELRDSGWLAEQFGNPSTVAYWSYVLDRTHRERDAWDYAWLLSCWRQGGLNAIPNLNLVSNLGFREDATNTKPQYGETLAALPVEEMEFPLRHPAEMAPHPQADRYIDRLMFGGMVSDMLGRVRHFRDRQTELQR
jgi:hypothetical protein